MQLCGRAILRIFTALNLIPSFEEEREEEKEVEEEEELEEETTLAQ